MPFTIAEIAQLLAGEVVGDGAAVLTGFATAEAARPGDLTFAETDNYFAAAEKSAARAIIVGSTAVSSTKILIRVANPRIAFAKAMSAFFPEPKYAAGIHPSAVIARSAQIDPTVHIGPHCTIGERVQLGAHVVLQAGNFIGDDSALGEATNLFPNVTLYPRTHIGQRVRLHAGTVIGADGYGYVLDQGVHRKIPQVGNVVIGDDVEIGANVTVDRGALGATIIGKGSKIDNLVQIGHNVQIGEHCIVIAQVGIAGSCKLGNYVILAGQAGLGGHLDVGDKAIVGAQAGVMNHIPAGEKWLGSPAQPDKEFKRQVIAQRHLPGLLKKIAAWEKKLGVSE
jgi:UDP-3-O-[3-hydroxymyristoyl] glucosamine N-acyltransferase